MKVPLYLLLSVYFCVGKAPLAAGSLSYVVLQDSDRDSLVRVSANGKQTATIASGVGGVDLTLDRVGNYVVAARSALKRVTPSGVVTTIANAPAGSEWIAVVADSTGNLLAADDLKHIIWRISEDGQSVTELVRYPGKFALGGSDLGLTIDKTGDCLLMRVGDDNAPHLYRISPTGSISPIPLRGAVGPPVRGFRAPWGHPVAVSGGPLVPDGSGNYFFLDDSATRNIFRLTADGRVTKFSQLKGVTCCVKGLARNPETGELIIADVFRLLRVPPDGSETAKFSNDPKLRSITAVVVEGGEVGR